MTTLRQENQLTRNLRESGLPPEVLERYPWLLQRFSFLSLHLDVDDQVIGLRGSYVQSGVERLEIHPLEVTDAILMSEIQRVERKHYPELNTSLLLDEHGEATPPRCALAMIKFLVLHDSQAGFPTVKKVVVYEFARKKEAV
jgi:hypothetical protein